MSISLTPQLTQALQHYFIQQPVLKAYLFGSVARGEATDQSDIDILVEMAKGATLFDQARMSWQLEDLLQRKVDLITEKGMFSKVCHGVTHAGEAGHALRIKWKVAVLSTPSWVRASSSFD